MKPNKIKNKKSQGMSINMIIVAVIALIVLIVLVIIFSGKINIFGKGVSNQTAKFGEEKCHIPGARTCMPTDECSSAGGREIFRLTEQCPQGELCCEY